MSQLLNRENLRLARGDVEAMQAMQASGLASLKYHENSFQYSLSTFNFAHSECAVVNTLLASVMSPQKQKKSKNGKASLFFNDNTELHNLIRRRLILPYLTGSFHSSFIEEYAGGLLMALQKPVGMFVDSEIVLSTSYGKTRVFINKTLSTETAYQQDCPYQQRPLINKVDSW